MDEYKQPYTILWNAISDAIIAIERQNYGLAMDVLKSAQEKAEEEYINEQ